MAEIELGILQRQSLDRRQPDRETVATEVAAWQHDRNTAECCVNWQFTTAGASIKLRRLYPIIEPVNSSALNH